MCFNCGKSLDLHALRAIKLHTYFRLAGVNNYLR